jgi:hypothetical protein
MGFGRRACLGTGPRTAKASHGDDLEDSYISRASPIVQRQLLNGGVPLAKVLDENS